MFFVADDAGRRHLNVVAGQVHQPLPGLLEQGLAAESAMHFFAHTARPSGRKGVPLLTAMMT